MRKAALLFVIAVFVYAANAQFTLQPRFGFENPVTKVSYNKLPYSKPVSQFFAQAGVRGEYQFKKGFAPFFGVFTHRPLVSYSFDDPKTGMTAYKATAGDLKIQLQTGLQFSSQAIRLSKKTSASNAKTENVSESNSGCYHSYSGCCHKRSSELQASKRQKDMWYLRLQPSAGIGYVPSGKQDIEIQNSGTSQKYIYNAGNIKSEFMTGMGFELVKNKKRFLTLNVNYFKGFNGAESILTTESDGKPLNTTMASKISGWNASIGIPVSFAKKSSTTKTQTKTHHSCCEYYRSRCSSYRKI